MNNSRFSDALVGIIHSIPHSYSTIFFSDSSLLGLVILAVTFLSPIIGLAGFIGLLSAILISRIMGFSVWDSKSGILSFNSLITSLAVGYYYPMQQIQQNPYLFLIYVLAASCFSLFLFIGLNYLTQTYLHMPAMSLSFSISALILWFYFVKVGYITGFFEPKFAFQLTALSLPRYWELYFVSLGSIMFMPNILAGLVIAIVLLVISRIGFLLSLLGWSVCYLLLAYLPGQAVNGLFFPGFNLILISLAIGGVYLIPSKSSWLLAILASVIGFYLALAMSSIYHHINPYTGFYTPLAIPIFAFPLNVGIIVMVFVLRL
ncbi:MAG: urea transporter [Candidatus Cloacimonetes bacterium]|nr:urea transporter [Candidatus Cloacimonadota bacterium]